MNEHVRLGGGAGVRGHQHPGRPRAERPRPVVVWTVAGAGAGNATRAMAILEALGGAVEVHFAAQGGAAELLPQAPPVLRLEGMGYGSAGFSPVSVVRANWDLPGRWARNAARCAALLDALDPDAVIADSDVHALAPATARGIPVVCIGSVEATLRHSRPRTQGVRFSYHVVERADAWLQRRHARLVICPVLHARFAPRRRRLAPVPPIVRRAFLDRSPPTGFEHDVAVLLGGSGIGAEAIDLRDVPGRVVAIGAHRSLPLLPRGCNVLPFLSDPVSVLARARVLVVQGGFNSVSEALALRRPTVVVPIPGHAEQGANARIAQALGFALEARPGSAGGAVRSILEEARGWEARCARLELPCDGAARAAEHLRRFLGIDDA